jgi:ankyrin repeat protein
MSLRELPARPNLEHLKNQARTLLQQRLASDSAATARFAAFGLETETPKHADALHVIAREYGFATWPALKLRVEAASDDPVAALTAAVKSNDASLVRKVLTRHPSLQAKINEPLPNYGFDAPALFAAVNHKNREMIDILLDAGANVNERTRWWAGSFGVLDSAEGELANYLISRGAVIDIHAAARLGMIDRVRELVARDPQLVHARGGDGQFPLHFASTVEIAAFLLDAGADIDARDIDHESTAVQYMVCIRPHRHAVAKYLISRGAQADIFAAAAIGDLALVERILNDDPETVRTTVNERHFPKLNPRSGGIIYMYGFGITRLPHMVAHEFGHTAVFDLLMQRSAPWMRLLLAAEIGDESLAQKILRQQPALISRMSENAARRIVGAAIRNNTRAVEMLLEYGWPAGATLENNQTALHYAAWHGNLAIVRALLARNAAVSVFENQHGGTPLGWALHGSLNSWHRDKGDYPGVTRALLAAGAEIPKSERPLEATEDVLEIIRQQVH